MNHTINDYVTEAIRLGIAKEELHFRPAKVFSPYMECAPAKLNVLEIPENRVIEVNPLFRSTSLFADLLSPDHEEIFESLKEELFDQFLHLLVTSDGWQNMTWDSVVRLQMSEEISGGVFGQDFCELWSILTIEERETVLIHCFLQETTENMMDIFRNIVMIFFPHCAVFLSEEQKVFLFASEKRNRSAEQKIELLRKMFLPIGTEVEIYWEYPFGVFDERDPICLEEIVLIE